MNESSQGQLGDALAGARPRPTLEEHTALAELEARLFAKAPRRPKLSRYRLRQQLGAGAMAVVYAAHDPELDRDVAIKLMQWRGPSESLQREQLLVEAQMLARIDHPNVVGVYDVGQYGIEDLPEAVGDDVASAGFFVVMEYVQGQDLSQWLADSHASAEEIVDIFVAAGRGLAYAHTQGVVHRDFKPSNVLVGHDGAVKVVDFGLAVAELATTNHDAAASESQQGPTIVGTPAYMAPEQQRGLAVDHRADQFAFCASLAEALFGRRMFIGRDWDDLLSAKLQRQALLERPDGVPTNVRTAIERGLNPDPAGRFDTMDTLLNALTKRARGRALRWVVPVVALAALGAMVPRSPDCHATGVQSVEHTWSDTRREQVRSAFAAVDSVRGPVSAEHAIAGLDEYAWRWTSAHATMCTDSNPASDTRTAWQRCLERNRIGWATLTASLAEAQGATVDASVKAVSQLRDPAACASTAERDDTPNDPRRDAIEGRLARARALQHAMRYEDAMAEAVAAQAQAEHLGDEGLAAAAMVRQGFVLDRQANSDAADALLRQAYFQAERAGAPLVAARAATQLVASFGRSAAGLEHTLGWARHARSQLARYGGAPETEEVLEANLGIAMMMADDRVGATEHLERALQMREAVEPEGDWRTAAYLDNLGMILLSDDRVEEAEARHRRAYDVLARDFGPEHKSLVVVLDNLGRVQRQQGNPEGAVEYSQRALEITRRGADHNAHAEVYSLVNIGRALLDLDRPDDALEHFNCGLGLLDGLVPAAYPGRFDLRSLVAQAHRNAGRHRQARAELRSMLDDMLAAGLDRDQTAAKARRMLQTLPDDATATALPG